MLSLSKKTDYALIALAYLAERPQRTASAREIAQAFGLPAALLMNILKSLQQRSIIASQRGTKGGYRLNMKAEAVSLHDLIEAVDGPVQITECSLGHGGAKQESESCKVRHACPVQGPIVALHHKVVQFLRDVKLSDVIVPGERGQAPHKAGRASGLRRPSPLPAAQIKELELA